MRGRALYEAARQAVPLPELWQQYGFPLTQHGRRFATPYTPCCGTASRPDAGSLFIRNTGEWAWHCFRCGVGGSSIDLVAKQEGLTAHEAAKKLVGAGGGFTAITGREAPKAAPRTTSAERYAATEKIIQIISERRGVDPQVRSYLNGRGLSDATIDEAEHRGMLRTLPGNPDAADVWLRLNCGEEMLTRAGMLKGRRAAAAYRPLAFLPPSGSCVEFRTIQDNPNGPKALQHGDQLYPLVWHPNGETKKILVVEGGIDLLSVVDLGFTKTTLVLGLFGASAWRDQWITQIQGRYPDAKWEVGYDADLAGDTATPRLLESLANAGIRAERLVPWGGGADTDWNDTLLAARDAF